MGQTLDCSCKGIGEFAQLHRPEEAIPDSYDNLWTTCEPGFNNAQNNPPLREASHIDFVHEKRHMDVGGWGVGACDVSLWKSWRILIVWWKFLIFWNYLHKGYQIQHFHKCIYILSTYVRSLSVPGFALSVLLLLPQRASLKRASKAAILIYIFYICG